MPSLSFLSRLRRTLHPLARPLAALGLLLATAIREWNRLGIVVDMAHASAETLAAALKVAAHPVLVSHTGLDTRLGQNPDMTRMMRPRLISREQAKLVADAGGVIGVWTHLADTPLAYAENIRALVEVVGIDHVGLGTDTKLIPAYHPAGSGPPRTHAGERTNEAWPDQQAGFYYAVVRALLKTGFTQEEIGKLGGGNFCRVFGAATAGENLVTKEPHPQYAEPALPQGISNE